MLRGTGLLRRRRECQRAVLRALALIFPYQQQGTTAKGRTSGATSSYTHALEMLCDVENIFDDVNKQRVLNRSVVFSIQQ
jgi:hypothetical protein